MYDSFHTMQAFYRQTDGRTDGRTEMIYRDLHPSVITRNSARPIADKPRDAFCANAMAWLTS